MSRQHLSVPKPVCSFTYLLTYPCLSMRNHPFRLCFHPCLFLFCLLPFSCVLYVTYSFTRDFLYCLHSSLFLLFRFTRRYGTRCGPSDGGRGACFSLDWVCKPCIVVCARSLIGYRTLLLVSAPSRNVAVIHCRRLWFVLALYPSIYLSGLRKTH